MTFNFAPWAIDGARSTAGLARLASYAGGGGRSGVIQPTDLKVTPLAVAGNGVRIASGGATILNGYLTNPDESYVVTNPSTHTVLPADMPPAVPALSYYLVCVVIGDPEFDQTGHPFMPAGVLDPSIAQDFEYVRIVVLPCGPDDDEAEDIGVTYPAYALARLEIPANTTTITGAMITDLRRLATPRSERHLAVMPLGPAAMTGTDWGQWGNAVTTAQVPRWATHMQIVASMGGIAVSGPEAVAEVRVLFGAHVGPVATIDTTSGYNDDRISLFAGLDVVLDDSDRGIWKAVVLQGHALGGSFNHVLSDARTQVVFDVQFEERVL